MATIHPDMTAALTAELAKLRAENAKLVDDNAKLAIKRALRCKVSEKGALSVYGLNVQFPVTLYVQQWEKLVAFLPELQQFMKDNAASFSRK